MRIVRFLAVSLITSLALAAVDEPQPVKLDAPQQSRLGVVVAALSPAKPPAGVATVARVLDPGPLLTLDGELASAEASLVASSAEANRTRKLFDEDRTASARSLETANAQARADQEKVDSARRRLLLEWGDGVAALPPAKRSELLNDLARVRAELIRVELPVGVVAPKNGQQIAVRAGSDGPAFNAVVLGTLPAADPRLQTRGLLAELKGADATLPIGRMLTATLPAEGSASGGVLLPRGALLRKDAKVWAYVQTGAASFSRREVVGYEPVSGGWFVRSGFAPGDRVVTAGAASLLAIESPADAAD